MNMKYVYVCKTMWCLSLSVAALGCYGDTGFERPTTRGDNSTVINSRPGAKPKSTQESKIPEIGNVSLESLSLKISSSGHTMRKQSITTNIPDTAGAYNTPYNGTESAYNTPYKVQTPKELRNTGLASVTSSMEVAKIGLTPVSGKVLAVNCTTSATSGSNTGLVGQSTDSVDDGEITSGHHDESVAAKNNTGRSLKNNGKNEKMKDSRKILNIIGLFALTGLYPEGLVFLPSSLLATKHINYNHSDILPGYKLKINAYDTNCNESVGLDAFYQEVYNPNRTSIMVLGGTCSPVTEATAQVSHLWGLKQISYAAVSPHLSNKEIFPSFFRVMTPEQNLTAARVKLFQLMNWRRINIIYQNVKLWSTLEEYMKQDLTREGYDVVGTEMFTTDPTNCIENLKKNDARIIIVSMYEDKARKVMCTVYNLEGGGNRKQAWYKKVVWVVPRLYEMYWMDLEDSTINCTKAQIREVLGKYFTIGSQAYDRDTNYVAENGVVPSNFTQLFNGRALFDAVKDDISPEFLSMFNHGFHDDNSLVGQHRAPEAYDCVWAIARALNNTLAYLINSGDKRRLEDFHYKDSFFSQLIQSAMRNVTFKALSGPFSFNDNGERLPGILISRFNGDNTSRFIDFGRCHLNGTGIWDCNLNDTKIVWENGQIPVDGLQKEARVMRINCQLRYSFWSVASLGIVLSLCLLVFNVVKRTHRIIKMSSPKLNNLILVGCMVSYSTVFILEGDGITCVFHTFTIVLGFSLSFGALFAKTWRVYEIFTAGHKVLNTRMLRDSSLFLIVAVLVVINSLTLVGWMVASPQEPTLVNISTTPSPTNKDIEYINQYRRCDSAYRLHFMATLLAIQGVVILFGTFLAIQTRKVSCPELNDSKWITMCIYNVVVLGPVGVVVVMATDDKPEINYALESGMLILVTTMTQCLVFVPKIIAYRNHNLYPTLDVKLNVKRINKTDNIFVVEQVPAAKRVSCDASTSCGTSQQTEAPDLSRLNSSCNIHNAHEEVSRNKVKPCGGRWSSLNDQCHSTDVSVDNTLSEHDLKCVRFGEKNDVCGTHLFPRSKSDSCILECYKHGPSGDLSVYSKADQFWELQEGAGSARNLVRREDSASSNGNVIDQIRFRADLKVLARIGFKAVWREKQEVRHQNPDLSELINRLKEVINHVSGSESDQ